MPSPNTASATRVERSTIQAADRRARVLRAIDSMRAESEPIRIVEVARRSGVPRATIYRDPILRRLLTVRDEDEESIRPDSQTQSTNSAQALLDAETLVALTERLEALTEGWLERLEFARTRVRQAEQHTEYEIRRRERLLIEMERERREASRIRERAASAESRIQDAEQRAARSEKIAARERQRAEELQQILREAESKLDEQAANLPKGGVAAIEEARRAGYESGYQAGTRVALRAARRGSNALAEAASGLSLTDLNSARRRLARVLHPDLFADDPAVSALATELLKQINAIAARGV